MLYRANVKLKKKTTNSKRSTGKQSNSYLDDLSLEKDKNKQTKKISKQTTNSKRSTGKQSYSYLDDFSL